MNNISEECHKDLIAYGTCATLTDKDGNVRKLNIPEMLKVIEEHEELFLKGENNEQR